MDLLLRLETQRHVLTGMARPSLGHVMRESTSLGHKEPQLHLWKDIALNEGTVVLVNPVLMWMKH